MTSAHDVQRFVTLSPASASTAPLHTGDPVWNAEATAVLAAAPAGASPPAPSPPLLATSLTLLGVLLLTFVVTTAGLSHVVHARSQALHYAELREQLANGTAPVGVDESGAPIRVGTPVALLEIRSAGLRQVVLEGTTADVLRDGPGHRRDTVLPGQAGTAVVFGRSAAFGGPFSDVAGLRPGTRIDVTTGQGVFVYRITGTRRPGADAPPPVTPGAGRLTLVTATGLPYLPEDVVRVDADLEGEPAPTPARAAVALAPTEGAMAGDSSAVPYLQVWVLALLAAACAVAWLRVRWGLRQAWVVGVPLLAVLGVGTSLAAVLLLPNLL